MEEYAREPCPWRIIDDCGGAFSMGLIGGQWAQKASHLSDERQTSVTLTLNNHTIHTCYTKLRLQNLFLTGCIFQGGGFFNMLGGAYNAPAGYQRRLMGGIIRVKERWVLSSLESENIESRAPLLGGQFAAWGICFSSFDCTFAHIRGKEVRDRKK